MRYNSWTAARGLQIMAHSITCWPSSTQLIQTDIDECALDEKKCNNGICQNLPGTYQCFCRPGFGGDHCETDFQECLSNPCENGGTCEDAVNDFICLCPPGFEGM